MQPNEMVNTLWVLIAAVLVFFMNAGFALLETGLCRQKNAVNILAKNFMVFGLAMLGYWAVGYALMFGEGRAVGLTGWFLHELPATTQALPTEAFFFFQLTFAATAATIVSGAVAERIKIQSFLLLAVILTSIIYPIVGHWAWGGGWLAELGFADFAGSTVVHSVGGWAALSGAVLLGPRLGRYGSKGQVRPVPGHNVAFVTIGGLILWMGWFGFNGGSGLAVDGALAHTFVTTALAGATGSVVATGYTWKRLGKPDLTLVVNGMLAGLVAVTASCAFIPLWAAAVIGGIAGVLVIEAVFFFDRRQIDDPVGALSVHLVCGALGTLMVGVFGQAALGAPRDGLVFGGGFYQLGIQALGVVSVGAFVGLASTAAWIGVRAALGLRVDADEERLGLDLAEMGMEAYPQEPGSI